MIDMKKIFGYSKEALIDMNRPTFLIMQKENNYKMVEVLYDGGFYRLGCCLYFFNYLEEFYSKLSSANHSILSIIFDIGETLSEFDINKARYFIRWANDPKFEHPKVPLINNFEIYDSIEEALNYANKFKSRVYLLDDGYVRYSDVFFNKYLIYINKNANTSEKFEVLNNRKFVNINLKLINYISNSLQNVDSEELEYIL